jgi:DNA repair exonuclease SbcCD ATPase subunit
VTTALVKKVGRQGRIRWSDWGVDPIDLDELEPTPRSEARYQELISPLTDGSEIREMETDFKDWIYHTLTAKVRANEELEIFAGPQVSQGEFRRMCAEAAEEALEEEREKIQDRFDKKLDTLKDRLIREERELDDDQAELSSRKLEEMGTHAENLISLLVGRQRRMTTSLTKRRMTSQAKSDVEESLDAIEEFKKEIEELEEERQEALSEVDEKWQEILESDTEISVTPYKKDILVEIFGVGWLPYYLYEDQGKDIELVAFS